MKAVICGAVLTMAISLPTVAQEELKGCDAKAFAFVALFTSRNKVNIAKYLGRRANNFPKPRLR